MSKFAIITEIECDILEWCTLTSCHSNSPLETIEWSMLARNPSPYLPPFRRYGSQKSLRRKLKMIMINMLIMNNQMKTPKV